MSYQGTIRRNPFTSRRPAQPRMPAQYGNPMQRDDSASGPGPTTTAPALPEAGPQQTYGGPMSVEYPAPTQGRYDLPVQTRYDMPPSPPMTTQPIWDTAPGGMSVDYPAPGPMTTAPGPMSVDYGGGMDTMPGPMSVDYGGMDLEGAYRGQPQRGPMRRALFDTLAGQARL